MEINSDILIDALFRTDLTKPVSGWIGNVIDAINSSGIPVISIDIPSGLFCDDNRGNDFSHVIKATETLTFQSPKLSFLFSKYVEFTGDFRVINIGLSDNFTGKSLAKFVTRADIKLKHRDIFSHKGTNGYLLLAAGFQNYAGAAILSAKAALRSGCGYAGVFCSDLNKISLISAVPEALYISEIHHGFPEKTNAVAVGPGLGTDEHSLNILSKILETKLPLVIDADAITLLASHRLLLDQLPKDAILTPHPAELARLIGKTDSPEDFLEKQIEFSKKYQVFILQKGAYSKLTTPQGEIFINSSGNPGMGTAGSGDVLTGIIGSLLAQKYSPADAVITGMFIHGYSADLVKREKGMIGMIASDLVEYLPKAFSAF
ncbi:MAG: NAD(P)H-hydrate dehydratase [Crocinitomicaceae bacterium]|nr:NAD(P)H-hydrate dehydratase [Crocinitomicaceae bacterium]